MTNRRIAGAFAALLATALGMYAAPANAQGDAERGKVLSYTCQGCHGIEGYRNQYPSYRVPMLGGQHAAYIEIALKAYRSGERSHATMRAQAWSLSDQDIKDIAAYFGSRGEIKDAEVVTSGVERGKEKSQTCVACHGERGVSANEIWPNLAGQHESYLENALLQYQLANKEETAGYGQRNNAVMAGLASTLSKRDIKDLAAYFAAQDGLYTTKKTD
ncbi:MAG: c-type cytochrome [Pseudomonadota bacterium]